MLEDSTWDHSHPMMHEAMMRMVGADWQAEERCERSRQELTQQRAALEDWTVLAVMQSQHESLKVQGIQCCKVSCAQPVGRYAKGAKSER